MRSWMVVCVAQVFGASEIQRLWSGKREEEEEEEDWAIRDL
jgi:hypothetical protein